MNIKLNNKVLAVHLLRISFGINFLFHGVVRLPVLGKFVAGMQDKFQDTLLPDFLVTPMAYLIPFAEVIIGLLLLFNKFTREALIASFILINTLVIGSSVLQDWKSVGLKLSYIGFLFILLYFTNDNQKSSKE